MRDAKVADLANFLRARLDEDEAAAQALSPTPERTPPG
ncbi:DUF6221 family protein [Streptomyces albidoflavus]